MHNEQRPSFLASNQQITLKRLKFLIVFLCLALIAILAIAITSLMTSQRIYRDLTRNVDQIADSQAAAVIQWLEEFKSDAAELASSPACQQMDEEGATALFDNYMKLGKNYSSFKMISIDELTAETDDDSATDSKDRVYIGEALAGNITFSNILFDLDTWEPKIFVVAPVKQGGKAVGVIFMVVNISEAQGSLSSAQFGSTGETYLIDKQGFMLTALRREMQSMENQEGGPNFRMNDYPAGQIAQQNSGSGFYDNYESEEVYGAYRVIPGTDLGLVVEQQESEIQSKVLPPRILAVLFFLLSAIDGSVIVLLLVVFIMNSRKKTEGTTGQISAS